MNRAFLPAHAKWDAARAAGGRGEYSEDRIQEAEGGRRGGDRSRQEPRKGIRGKCRSHEGGFSQTTGGGGRRGGETNAERGQGARVVADTLGARRQSHAYGGQSTVTTRNRSKGGEARENTHFAKRTQFSARRWGNRKVHCQKPTQIGLPAEDEILCHGGTMVVAVHLTNTAPESPLTEGAGLLDFTREVSPVSWRSVPAFYRAVQIHEDVHEYG
jgi:hypothetical protein